MTNKRDQNQDSRATNTPAPERRREISGPGAADFIASPVGLDLPESDPAKGMAGTHGEAVAVGPVAPDLDEPEGKAERQRTVGGARDQDSGDAAAPDQPVDSVREFREADRRKP